MAKADEKNYDGIARISANGLALLGGLSGPRVQDWGEYIYEQLAVPWRSSVEAVSGQARLQHMLNQAGVKSNVRPDLDVSAFSPYRNSIYMNTPSAATLAHEAGHKLNYDTMVRRLGRRGARGLRTYVTRPSRTAGEWINDHALRLGRLGSFPLYGLSSLVAANVDPDSLLADVATYAPLVLRSPTLLGEATASLRGLRRVGSRVPGVLPKGSWKGLLGAFATYAAPVAMSTLGSLGARQINQIARDRANTHAAHPPASHALNSVYDAVSAAGQRLWG
jgi:hypothetical protein